MDAIDMLTRDHDKVRELFKQWKGGGGLTGLVRRIAGTVEPRERKAALAAICQELETHTRIEEEIFYPAVRALGDPELDDQLREALSEHAKVKQQVRVLRGKSVAAKDVDGRMDRLDYDVEHHASEEEKEMFPRVEQLMPATERAEIARRMQALQKASAAPSRGAAKTPAGTRKRTAAAKRPATPKRAGGRKQASRKATVQKRAKSRAGKKKTARARRR